jgi:hypothetical protein
VKKIVSFTLFGTEPKYYVGAEKNIVINKKLLPDWESVIYYHPELTRTDNLKHLESIGAKLIDVSEVVIGNKKSTDFPFFWRFLAFLDDNITIVRDLDSRVSDREVQYIDRWLNNDKDYFIIRDHPWNSPVPSGLFGIKGKKSEFEKHFNSFVESSDLRWGTDQDILYEYMKNVPSEEVEYCGFDKIETYIPRIDKEFFIGIQLDENDKPTIPSGELCLKFLKELNL